MSQKNILITSFIIVAIAFTVFVYTSNQTAPTPKTEVAMSKKIETPVKNDQGEYVSTLVEFKVKSEKDKYTITYPRGKFDSKDLGKEIGNVLKNTDMVDANKLSIAGGAGLNEAFYSDTNSECGFTDPSSAWCFRLTNDKVAKTVEIIIQKGKFEAKGV
jgi:hypothetical protein